MTYIPPLRYPALLILLGLVCFFPMLGSAPLFDWDEINFAESAREMLITKDYFRVYIDFVPFTEKPPLFFWLQALSMQLWGVNEFAARFPNAVFGILVLLSLYYTGKRLMDERFGLIWALAYLGSILPHLYFRSGIIDPVFNFFMFLGVGFLARTVYLHKMRGRFTAAALAGLFTGLAVLTKGPVGFLLVFLSFLGYWAYRRFNRLSGWKEVVLYAVSTLLVTMAWYGVETYKHGFTFLEQFVIRQVEIFSTSDAGHGKPFYYHFVVLLIGCFPISVLSLKGFFAKSPFPGSEIALFRHWMISLFIVVLTVFSISTTKIVHYSSMAYYPLSFLAAYHVYNLSKGRWLWHKAFAWLGIGLGLVLGILLTALPLVPMFKQQLIPYIKDAFAVGNLQANPEWGGWEWSIGLMFIGLSCLGWYYFSKGAYLKGSYWLFGAVAATMVLYTSAVVPKISEYTQGANVRFFKSLAGKEVYCGSLWYKSYAPYFYGLRQPGLRQESRQEAWLLYGEIDRPVYLSVKINDRKRMEELHQFVLLREENGFLYYLREPIR